MSHPSADRVRVWELEWPDTLGICHFASSDSHFIPRPPPTWTGRATTVTMDEISPFSQYLNTNYAPSDSEIAILKQLVRDREATAAALADEIEEAKKGLATQTEKNKENVVFMERRLVANRQFIEDHTMLLSPIRRVPLDVLSLLFQTTLESVEQSGWPEWWPYYHWSAHPTTTITQVCAGWRTVALQMPTLWTHIHVLVPSPRLERMSWKKWGGMMRAQRRQVESWIGRASSCPFDVSFSIDSVYPPRGNEDHEDREEAMKQYEALLEALPTSHRRRTVYCNFDVHDSDVVEGLLKLFETPPFPLLRKAFFTVNGNMESPAQQASTQRLAVSPLFASPALRDVTLTGLWPDISVAKASSSSLLYESITHLVFHADIVDGLGDSRFNSAQALNLLKSLPKLVSAGTHLHYSSGAFRPLFPPIHLPHHIDARLQYALQRICSLLLTSPFSNSIRPAQVASETMSPTYSSSRGSATLTFSLDSKNSN